MGNPYEDKDARERARYILEHSSELREVAKSVLPRESFPSFHKCGRPVGGNASFSVSASGVAHEVEQACGSPWICPVCSSRIQYQRSQEIEAMLSAALDAGFSVYLVTFTIPHTPSDALTPLLRGLSKVNSRVMDSRPVKALGDEYGYLGAVRAFDVVYSFKSGWHPHFHNLLFYRKRADESKLARALFDRYAYQVKKRMGKTPLPVAFNLTAVDAGTNLAKYVSKFRLARYLNKSDKAASSSLYPFALLDASDDRKLALYFEFAHATKGISRIRTTKGLKAALGVQDIVKRASGSSRFIIPPAAYGRILHANANILDPFLRFLEDPSDPAAFSEVEASILNTPVGRRFWDSGQDRFEAYAYIYEMRIDCRSGNRGDGFLTTDFEELPNQTDWDELTDISGMTLSGE